MKMVTMMVGSDGADGRCCWCVGLSVPALARAGAHRLLQPQPPAAPPASDGCQRFQFALACSIMFYFLLLLGEGGQAQSGVHGCCAALRVRVDEPLCNCRVLQLLWLLACATAVVVVGNRQFQCHAAMQ